MSLKDAPRVVKDVWHAILEDEWMNIVVWGKPRTGKTTVQMQIAYAVYKDWDQVLESFTYNLAGILYHLDHGIPCRIMTRNKLHNRVPIIMPDDLGAHSNKAKTQHEPAMDIFKGAIDTYGTKMTVFLSSMGLPNEITEQLCNKYTHEIYVARKGEAKYDEVDWLQNYRGWIPIQKKDWQDEFTFSAAPMDVYKQYDEQRLSLVDELNQLIRDAMIDSEAVKLIRRLEPIDIEFLELIQAKGMIHSSWFTGENEKYKEVLKRCKARSLVTPVKTHTRYKYDLTDFGFDILTTIKNQNVIEVPELKEREEES